ncbi:MAG: MFS transporter [Proteobacteria bacterium]|nr:MFS transporter [Pseudomonadota bacterium]
MRLPVWALGFANLPLGLTGGLALLTMPQWLAARNVPEPDIAQLTTLALIASVAVFLLGPLFDVWFRRRTYAVACCVTAALGAGVAVAAGSNLTLLAIGLVLATGGGSANTIAVGGWLGGMIDKAHDATLGAWMVVANITGFGVLAMIGIGVIRGMPAPLAAALLAAPVLAPLLIYAVTPCPPPDGRLARESFGQFFGDLSVLVRRPVVAQTLMLFAVPAASFALTNTLGGLGRDYHAPESFVAVMGGAAAIAAGLVGSLMVPPLARRAPVRRLYLLVGIVGALFTLSLIVLPHTPALFAAAMIGQNVAQSAALSMVTVIALQSLGENNPFAATQFGLLNSASSLPIAYMQYLDGQAYGAGGLPLMYLADGGLGLGACLTMALLLKFWSRRSASEPSTS